MSNLTIHLTKRREVAETGGTDGCFRGKDSPAFFIAIATCHPVSSLALSGPDPIANIRGVNGGQRITSRTHGELLMPDSRPCR